MQEIDRDIKSFDEDCRKIHNSCFSASQEQNKILYHYTDYKGLEGILRSRTLRQTDSQYLNDPTELIFGMKYILDFLSDI